MKNGYVEQWIKFIRKYLYKLIIINNIFDTINNILYNVKLSTIIRVLYSKLQNIDIT